MSVKNTALGSANTFSLPLKILVLEIFYWSNISVDQFIRSKYFSICVIDIGLIPLFCFVLFFVVVFFVTLGMFN